MSTQAQHAVTPYAAQNEEHLGYKWMIRGLLAIDAYHLWIYSYNHISGADNGATFVAFIMATAFSLLAFTIKDTTIMFVNSIRHEDPLLVKWGWGLTVLALMACVFTATTTSQNTLSEKKANHYETFESRMNTLVSSETRSENTLKLAQDRAAKMTPENAESFLLAAQVVHDRKLEKINEQRTALLENKPLKQASGAGMDTDNHNKIIGLLITISAVVATIRYSMHMKSEHRIPAFSLAKKLNHAWTSSSDNFRSSNFAVNPLKGIFNGMFFGHKEDVIKEEYRINDPRVIDGDAHPSSYQNTTQKTPENTAENSDPAPEKTELSIRTGATLSEMKKHKAIYKIHGCPVAFVRENESSYFILIPSPDESEWLYVLRTRSPKTLSKLKNKTMDSKHFDAAIAKWHSLNGSTAEFEANSPIREKFTPNSSVIPESKQADTEQANSKRIPDEFEANSEGGEIRHNSLAELNAGHPREMTEEENDLYWAEVIARLDRGESVSTPYDSKDPNDFSKPQGWVDYEDRLLVKAMNHKSTQKVDGGTIVTSGPMRMFVPDEIKTVEERVAESDAQLSRDELLDDLMKLADTDDAEKKLEAISKTIDKLASDPMNHGIKFSPTKTKDELNLSYERVKALFEVKQQEGKISMTKPFKIVAKDSV